MKESIIELIKFHTQAKQEVWSLIEGLSQLKGDKMLKEDYDALNIAIIKAETEAEMRQLIIQDLTNLL